MTNASYDFVFKLYNVSSGGSAIWTETRTGGDQVPVTDGIFQVALGSVTSFASAAVDFTNDNLWLEITFAGEVMGTRIRLSSATYSLFAEQTQGLTIPSGKTVTFADTFTTSGAFPLTLTTTATTNATIPAGTVTLVDLVTSQSLTNKTIGSTGLVFSGATTDITTTGGEALTLVSGNNGSGAAGNVVIDVGTSSAGNGSILIGNAARTQTIAIGGGVGTLAIDTGSWDIGTSGAITGSASYNGLVVTANTGVITTGTWNASLVGLTYGGTNKNMTAVNGGIVWTDADSMEVSAAGTAGQILQSNGAAAPSWIDPSAGTNLWQQNSGALTPLNITDALNLGNAATASAIVSLPGTTNNNAFFNLGTGNVGIGLTNPSYKLHVSTATYDETNPVFGVNNTAASQGGNWFPLFGGLASGAGNGAQVQMLYGVSAANANRVEETFTYVSTGSTSNMLSLGFYGNNYPFNILYSGNVGIGDTSPASLLTVGSGDLFQVNSSGIISNIDNVAHTIDDVSGNLTLTSAGTSVMVADDLGVNGATSADITSSTTTATVFDTTVTSLSMGGVATTINLGAGGALGRTINIGTGTGADVIHIGDGGTASDTITIGASSSDLALSDANWSVSGAGAASFVSVSASSAIAANGGITFNDATDTLGAFTMAGTLDINTRSLSGTTGDINYTNFDVVGSSGNTDIGGTITAGSGNEVLTLSTGKLDADALTLVSSGTTGSTSSRSGLQTSGDGLSLLMGCTDGQLMEWTDSGGWACADDNTSAGAGVTTIQEGDSTIDGATNTVDFLGADFVVTSSPAGEANVAIDYANSGIIRNTDLTTGDGAGGTSSGSGMEIGSGGIGLLQGCTNGQVLKWNEASSIWECGLDKTTVQVIKTGADTISSDNTLNNDDELLFYMAANETWIFRVVAYGTSNTTPDFMFGASAPSGAACNYAAIDPEAGASTANITTCGNGTAVLAGNGAYDVYELVGTVVNGSTPGNLNFMWSQFTSNASNTTVAAGSHLVAYRVSGADLAEVYYTNEVDAVPGTVMQIDGSLESGVKKTDEKYQQAVVGVVTTKPGLVIGDIASGGSPVMIALSGRVPVRVSTENGIIKDGDYLTSSSVPGVAMKASKTGVTIGKALTGFFGDGEGSVMMFVNNTYTNGTLDSENKTSNQILSELVQNEVIAQETNLSEIYTDRVVAGLEIITPKITTQEIRAGLIVADRIQANSIEGLDAMVGRGVFDWLGQLETNDQVATDSATWGEVMGIKEDLEKTMAEKIEEYISAWFDSARTFVAEVIFKGKVEFLGGVIFDRDTAGVAVIPPISKSVEVVFEKEYATEPVVMISLRLLDATQSGNVADDMKAAVSNISTKGFTIILDEYTPHEIEYNWVAMAVKDGAKRQYGKSLVPDAVSVDEVAPTLIPTSTIDDSVTISSASATPTEEPTPEPTPTPVIKYLTILPNEWGHVKIRQERDIESAALGMTYPGNRYVWTEMVDDWYKVLSGEIEGWVKAEYVQPD